MEIQVFNFLNPLILLCFLMISLSTCSFIPVDNYLINCGSNTNINVDNRVFVGDLTKPSFLSLGSSSKTSPISVSNPSPSQNLPPIYNTARVFPNGAPATFGFSIKKLGVHLVRLHFWPFNSQNYNLSSAIFSVSVNGYSLFHRFSDSKLLLKEFILRVDTDKLEIVFSPEGEVGLGFINAIEVISAPDNLILDYGVLSLGSDGVKEYKNLSSRVLESVHRINVGGLKITPFNDTLWRTWIPDDDYLLIKSAAKKVSTTHTPNYKASGATREIAPDNVYMTAQEMDMDNGNAFVEFNLTWNFPVIDQAQYLVRLHFCDIVSVALRQLYFNLYINGLMAKEVDLSSLTIFTLAAPVSVDFLVSMDHSRPIQISVGPSVLSTTSKKNAILNGVEIMKIVDRKNIETEPKRKKTWIVLGSVLGGVAVLSLVMVGVLLGLKCRKKPEPAESLGWTPLRAPTGSRYSRVTETSASARLNGSNSLKIPFEEILVATNNFDKSLVIGSGGFGMVYKGVLRDGTKVAVKRGMPGSRQGLPEFQTEISVLSKIQHCHLVSMVGYCEEQRQQLTDKSDVYSFGVVMLEVLCARPAVDPLLAREQVNLAEWALSFQKRGLLEEIVDPHLKGEIKPSSLKKFGDTAQKCLADYGVDRPTMGDVLWNLEHALQLEVGRTTETNETSDSFTSEISTTRVVSPGPISIEGIGDTSDENLGMPTSEVFSQLISSEGR
ncbi:hypothetical protein Cgig2_007872 [Carnegiea gigantea]|uniref:Protein kinase domain-containing protein n=1 Tax=Carnegiea gigantea TaxID=171969 RepID=A0A9Q1QHJ6_9CARY|nr:hypothetical protein Cgig2_007872 [Carnegiea gigantea]